MPAHNAAMGKKVILDRAYLDSRSELITESGCRIWTGCTNKNGYGVIKNNGRWLMPHRVSWEVENGQIPAGLCICHKCDVPWCINPAHLYAGTQKQNIGDMYARGRSRKVDGDASRKVTVEMVKAILEAAGSQTSIASEMGIDQSVVSRIKAGKHPMSAGIAFRKG